MSNTNTLRRDYTKNILYLNLEMCFAIHISRNNLYVKAKLRTVLEYALAISKNLRNTHNLYQKLKM